MRTTAPLTDRRTGRTGRTVRRAVAATVGALTVSTTVALAPAGAAVTTDPVEVALATPGALDSVTEVQRLGSRTADESGVRLGVVTDTNGAAPGGISTTQIVVDRADLGRLDRTVEKVPGVVSSEVDRPVRLTADPMSYLQYGPGRIGVPALAVGLDGRGTTVAVIDSGVKADHRDLAPALADGRPRVLPGTSFLFGSPDNGKPGNVDLMGHGTHVAGIIAAAKDNGYGGAGIAPQAQILPVRVFNAEGRSWASDVAAAIRWSHDRGADVINMSLGAPGSMPASIASAIDHVTTDTGRGKAPTTVVASAGNEGTTYPSMWPAAHPRVVAVAATGADDAVTSFSSRGTYVDLAAPGLNVLSTCRSGAQCAMSGTSMAAPAVAAAAAVLRSQDRTRTPAQVQAMLESTATDLGTPGKDVASGAGLVRIDRAVTIPTPAVAPARPVTVPARPASVRATCTTTSCSVGFVVANDGGAPVTTHMVLAVPKVWGPAGGLAAGTTSPVTVGNLTPGSWYTLVVWSGNRVGFGEVTSVTARTQTLAEARAAAQRAAAQRVAAAAARRR